jgi:serpin B
MRSISRIMLAAAGLLVAAGLLPACSEPPPAVNHDEASARFAWNLYRQTVDTDGNLFFSPYSVASALGMTLLGARGVTEREMQQVLFGGADHHAELGRLTRQLTTAGEQAPDAQPDGPRPDSGPGAPGSVGPRGQPDADIPPYELTVANALWLQDGFALRREFLDASERHYGARPFTVDYRAQPEAARQRINTWVSEQTRQRIVDLLAPGSVHALTRLILTNAIYFKSGWQSPFIEGATQPAPFHRRDGSTVQAPLMRQTSRLAYRELDDAQVLRLPYRGGELAMLVVLPRTADGLAALESSLTPETLLALIAGEGATMRRVEVHLPRFRVEHTLDLGPHLAVLGMPSAFVASQADFSGMTGGRDLMIDAVVHKAFVEVDEEGTEAAAATAVTMMPTSMPGPQDEPIVFKADRPFLFAIVHQTSRAILFLGRVTDPS